MLDRIETVGAALFALVGAALITAGIARWSRLALPGPPRGGSSSAVFLFEGEELVDASPAARPLLPGPGAGPSDLRALLALLSRGFGADLAARVGAVAAGGRLLIPSLQGRDILEVAQERGALRLTLRLCGDGGTGLERLSFASVCEELILLRGIAEDAPGPIWALGKDGQVTWANRAYLALVDLARDPAGLGAPSSGPPWPATPLLATPAEAADEPVLRRREALSLPGRDGPMWFDVTTVRRGSGSLKFATDVAGLVQAESARVHFVQALAKTFAHLSTGLAIFDRQRRLVLFNPAFVDLTGLPIAFLSARPLVHTVLDRLREAEVLPEPRDYASWREEMAALEAAAERGQYVDTWTLPSGRTYRVTGRPHPDGALAFLFEDISDELGQTRRLRTELDASRAALDAAGKAVAVFGPTEVLVLANAAYDDLWGPPAGSGQLRAEIARWEAGSAPSPFWDELRAAARVECQGWLRRPDGREWLLRMVPLPHGATLVTIEEPGGRQDNRVAGSGSGPSIADPSGAPGSGRNAPARALPSEPVPTEDA